MFSLDYQFTMADMPRMSSSASSIMESHSCMGESGFMVTYNDDSTLGAYEVVSEMVVEL